MAEPTFADKIINSVIGKIFILTLQTVLSSMVLLLAILFRQAVDITLLKYSIVILVGILAGFSARRFLIGHTLTLKLLVSFLTTALSLAVLYLLSAGFLGINLFVRSANFPDWQSLLQLGFAAAGAFLVVLAFRAHPAERVAPVPAAPVQISNPGPRPDIKPSALSPDHTKPSPKLSSGNSKKNGAAAKKKTAALKVTPSKTNQKKTAKKSTPKKSTKSSGPNKLAAAPASTLKKKTTRSKKKEKKEIKFIGEMEHTCPYCLDPVLDHDPRGVKICPICKTRHHADCWGITGACQIPHSHE